MVTIGIRAFSCIYLVVMHMNNSARYIRILEIIFIVVLWLNSYHKNGLFSVALLAFSSIKTYDLLLNFELPFCRSFSKMCLSQLWHILYEFISHYVGLIHEICSLNMVNPSKITRFSEQQKYVDIFGIHALKNHQIFIDSEGFPMF